MTSGKAIVGAGLLLAALGAPAHGQVDLVGNWDPIYDEDYPERIPGPEVGDYVGLPINAAAQFRADSWTASLLTLPEHQCKPHPVGYGYRGPTDMRIQEEVDFETQRIVKITVYVEWMAQYREIWMDERPPPSLAAPHTWQGFSTGVWEGDTLVVMTTHMKAGWVRRNGLPYSDRATFVDRWTRHGDYLTHVAILQDPVYLTEPFVRTTNWVAAPTQELQPYPCEVVTEIAGRELGDVPHVLPGENPMLEEYAERLSLPLDAIRGGAETAMPEFMVRGRQQPLAEGPIAATVGAPAPQGVQVYPVQGNVSVVTGAGGNVVVQVGDDGVLVVDTGVERLTDDLIDAIEELSGGAVIRWIVNTHAHRDHTGGNLDVSAAGEALAPDTVFTPIDDAGTRANIVAHEAAFLRLIDGANGQPPPFGAWPTSTIIGASKDLFFNGESIRIFHAPSGHTDGDLLVHFRKSDVVATGDLYVTTGYPRVIVDQGGSIEGEIAALNRIIDLTVPQLNQEGGTYVVPGHGRVVDESDVVDYRDMVTIVRDRVRAMLQDGLSLADVQAARPTRDYDGRFAAPEGPGSASAFVESIDRSLQAGATGP